MAACLRAEMTAIQRLHLLPVVMVADAIEQRRDPVWVQLQVRHLLPEALAALPVSPHELGFDQLARQQKHELLLLACRRVQRAAGSSERFFAGAAMSLVPICSRRMHGCRSRLAVHVLDPWSGVMHLPLQDTVRWSWAGQAPPAGPCCRAHHRHQAPAQVLPGVVTPSLQGPEAVPPSPPTASMRPPLSQPQSGPSALRTRRPRMVLPLAAAMGERCPVGSPGRLPW